MVVPEPSPLLYEDIVRRELLTDLGVGGDITTDRIVPASLNARGLIAAREMGIMAGAGAVVRSFTMTDSRIRCRSLLDEGNRFESGQTLFEVEGPLRPMLTAERTALNFLGHLSGIATLTARFVEVVLGTGVTVSCTRKTTPGLRALEKHAVRCGGGANHRFGLDDAVLIKDNHIAAAGSVSVAVDRARQLIGHLTPIELEVDTLLQLEEGLELGVDAFLLDNMDPEMLRRAVLLVAGRAVTEASGGITLETAAAVAATGVDIVSVGALTHSAPALDVGLELELNTSPAARGL